MTRLLTKRTDWCSLLYGEQWFIMIIQVNTRLQWFNILFDRNCHSEASITMGCSLLIGKKSLVITTHEDVLLAIVHFPYSSFMVANSSNSIIFSWFPSRLTVDAEIIAARPEALREFRSFQKTCARLVLLSPSLTLINGVLLLLLVAW